MKTEQAKQYIDKGYKIRVCLRPNKDYTGMKLCTELYNEQTGLIKDVYYNHVKKLLTPEQITFIDTYKSVKSLQYRDLVALNVRTKSDNPSEDDIRLITMYRSIKNMEYVYQ